MARRKTGGSSAGMGVMIVLGGIVWVGTSAYHFIEKNAAAIIAALLLSALIFLIIFGISRVGKNKPVKSAELITPHGLEVQISGPYLSRGVSRKTANAKWIDRGETVKIHDFDIRDGLFYVGDAVAVSDGRIVDQYVVNPNLPVSDDQSDVPGKSMSYWPSYAAISSPARRAFLEWMAGGRRDPTYGIGFVFLFFYGLEHKVFIEKSPVAMRKLIPEVDRLLSIYGQNGSFRSYATEFLTFARIAAGLPLDPPRLSPERNVSPDLPAAVRIYLGQKLAVSNVLYEDDVLIWLLALPDTYLRTPAIRCFDEFVALWKLRFIEKFPEGFKVNVPIKKIEFKYRAASGAFQVDVPGSHTLWPDIAAVRQSLDKLKSTIQVCTDELDAFSRFVGRRPDQKSSIQAALLLPEALQQRAQIGALRNIGERLNEIMGAKNTATRKLHEILNAAAFNFPATGKLPPTTCDQLGRVLDRLDIAIEPDRRYGGGVAQIGDQVVIFRADRGGPIDPEKPSFQQKKVQVEVSALAAAADGSSTVEELQTIIANIKSAKDLSRIEGLRLIAYAITIFKSPPKQERIMRRLADCAESERQAIAMAALSVMGRENIDPKKVQFLERLNKALKLPKDKIYTDIHRAAALADETVVISPENRIAGIPIPKLPEPGIHIDARRLAEVQKQTQAVSAILTQIFAEDTDGPKTMLEIPRVANGSAFNGLDRGHAELVEYMEIKGEISRQEFEEQAKALKLLPDGAIEKINDWSFDHFDEPLLEEGEHIVLSANLRDRLAELRESQS